ncbi:MAG TPA: BON domain-containing protein [Caulobacterales bacterium]|nr:BON domain-containing protein [Caulobacterales bacterium]
MDRRNDRDERHDHEPGHGAYGSGYGSPGRASSGRGWLEKASDEVASWFGDEHAEQRRRWDQVRSGEHRGRHGDYDEDAELRREVEYRLGQDEFFGATDIHVHVRHNEAILRGVVNYQEESREAERVARGVRGIVHVTNELHVRSRVERATIGMGYDQED